MIYYIVTIIIDYFSIFFTSSYSNLNIFFPLILISSIPIIYSVVEKKVFLISIIILGILYDLMFSFVFFLNTSYFMFYYLFLHTFFKIKEKNIINIFLISIFGFILYDFYIFLILKLLNYNTLVINDFYYKIYNSILLNTLYIVLSLIIMRSRILGFENSK